MNKFFLIRVLTLCFAGTVFAVPADAELTRLEKENRELRQKLLETERKLENYQVWLSSAGFDHNTIKVPDREKQLLRVMEEITRRGNMLSMSSLAVSDECRRLLKEMPLGPVRKAQIELRLDELEHAAGRFAGLAIPGNSDAAACRVLAVNSNLKAVVISAGAGNGIFPGMIFHAKNNSNLRIRVVSVLFEGALAEVINGNISSFAPGMEMSALTRKTPNREHILEL
ncbi:MAG: hypothetical protein E7058_04945 [Lentisphaerae bacterium]|nr:hypothetical protein [Lentisphaerota bacterium]